MLMIISSMIGVIVVVKAARRMVMAVGFPGVGVQEPVGVLVHVFVKVGVFHITVAMGVVVQVVVLMAVFVFMLQGTNGAAAVSPV